jgi:hypothetical protein
MSIQFFKKAATNPFAKQDSGGIVLRGINPGYSTEAPTFSVVIAAGGNSATATLNSGNAAQFEFIRVGISDSIGKGATGLYAGAPIVLNTTNVSKAQNSTGPDASLEVVYKLVGQEQILSYSVNIDAGTLVTGATINTALRLDADDRGAFMAIGPIVYDGTLGAEDTTITITDAIGLVGYTVEVTIDGGSATNAVIGADGSVVVTIAGIRLAGVRTVKATVTNAGAEYGSFQTATFTV